MSRISSTDETNSLEGLSVRMYSPLFFRIVFRGSLPELASALQSIGTSENSGTSMTTVCLPSIVSLYTVQAKGGLLKRRTKSLTLVGSKD